jgi:cytochrome oxidase assembly protein ShyY1
VRSLSFLLSRRWILFGIVVALLAWAAWALGQWQFHRLDERQERNAIVARNVAADPVPAADVLAVGEPVPAGDEWRRVTAVGSYDVADTVVVRYRTRDGAPGVDVVVPLVTREGPVLLVDRGWLATDNRGTRPEDVPAPPAGEVTVTGRVRRDGSGGSTRVTDHSTRAVSSREIGQALDLTTYAGFVDLVSEDPSAERPLALADPPEQGAGPHFFYGLQWWFFGLLAVCGFGYLAYDEWRRRERGSQRAEHPAVHGEHGAADV